MFHHNSCYLPRSQTGYSKVLICTGYVIVYPSMNLQAATVCKHILTYLSSHLLPGEIKADFGSEFKKEFDQFLANYGISLSSCKPLSKGSTSQAESVIRLVKSALRQLCMSHTSNWHAMVPIMLQGLNQQCFYGTGASRSQLYFSPFSYPNNIKLNSLLFQETIYNQQFDKINEIIQRRKKC